MVDVLALARAIKAHRKAFAFDAAKTDIALALRWRGAPAYERIHAFALGVKEGLGDLIAAAYRDMRARLQLPA